MNEASQVIELLTWVKARRLWPDKFSESDLFVIPISNTITTFQKLKPHQKKIALWLPHEKALRQILTQKGEGTLKTWSQDGIYFARLEESHEKVGIGIGRTEVLLSLLQSMRRYFSMVPA